MLTVIVTRGLAGVGTKSHCSRLGYRQVIYGGHVVAAYQPRAKKGTSSEVCLGPLGPRTVLAVIMARLLLNIGTSSNCRRLDYPVLLPR